MKERIRTIMEHVQLSQQDFAARLGISPASLSSIFNGRSNPTHNHVMAVHRAFPNINISWLMFGEGPMVVDTGTAEKDGSADQGDWQTSESLDAEQENLLDLGASVASPSAAMETQTGVMQRHQGHLNGRSYAEAHSLQQPIMQIPSSMINIDKKQRKIKEIRVFFDDGTYESFVPSTK